MVTAPAELPGTDIAVFAKRGSKTPRGGARGRKRGRRPGRWLILGSVIALVALAAGAGTFVLGRSSGLSGKTAGQVLNLTMAAARAEGSLRLVVVDTGASAGTSTYDVARSDGIQKTSTPDSGSSTLFVISGEAFLQADQAFLENGLGFPGALATAAAGQWISFQPSDPGYAQLVAGDTLSSALTESTPTGVLNLTPVRTMDGRQVVGISGGLTPDDAQGGATGTMTLYVSDSAPYLPVEAVVTGTLSGQSGRSTLTFSHWGEAVSVSAPSSSTPYSLLAAAGQQSSSLQPSSVPS